MSQRDFRTISGARYLKPMVMRYWARLLSSSDCLLWTHIPGTLPGGCRNSRAVPPMLSPIPPSSGIWGPFWSG